MSSPGAGDIVPCGQGRSTQFVRGQPTRRSSRVGVPSPLVFGFEFFAERLGNPRYGTFAEVGEMGGDGRTDVCSDDVGGAEEPGGLASSSTRSPRDISPAARAERPAVAQVKASVHPLPARRKRQPATGDGDDSAPRRTGIGEGGESRRVEATSESS